MRPVFVTTCKGRTQHLELTLPKNLADNQDCSDAKFVVLDYNSQDNLTAYLKTRHEEDIKSGRLVVYSFPTAGSFHMAHAKNMAHRLGILEGGDILINLDADNYTGLGFANYVVDTFRAAHVAKENIFLWARMIHGKMARGINGRIAVTCEQFINVGGYDEKYNTWAPDDKDFNARLRRLGYIGREIDERYLDAVRHTDRMRFREYAHAATTMGEDEFDLSGQTATVVNYGKLGEGVVYRNFDMGTPIALDPLPTRIFGIGLHKTGTTSLHTALSILGYQSAHWENAHWARAIWEEMSEDGRSLTLERSYALSDLPLPLLYRQLDEAYPGSKFILTIREEEAWIKSVENHWSHESNRFRADWSKDPFTHRVHKLLYGQKGFDKDLFLERYRRHNAEVIEYFSGRPEDLLVMDMSQQVNWDALCEFLGKRIPKIPYPKAFPTRKRGRHDV